MYGNLTKKREKLVYKTILESVPGASNISNDYYIDFEDGSYLSTDDIREIINLCRPHHRSKLLVRQMREQVQVIFIGSLQPKRRFSKNNRMTSRNFDKYFTQQVLEAGSGRFHPRNNRHETIGTEFAQTSRRIPLLSAES